MTQETTSKEEKETPAPAAKPETNFVTSSKTIDWPEYGWGIHAGETRELPVEQAQREAILSNPHITKVKN